MKKLALMTVLLAAVLASCSRKDRAVITVSMNDAQDSTSVVFSRLLLNELQPLDTVVLKQGKGKYVAEVREGSPEFIYLQAAEGPQIALLASAGEKISLELGADYALKSLSGSEHSTLLQQVGGMLSTFDSRFEELSRKVEEASLAGDRKKADELKQELARLYVQQKKESIAYVYDHPYSLSVIPLIYHRTPGGLPVFYQSTDGILFQRIYDSLYRDYATSPYLVSLADEIALRKNAIEMEKRLEMVEELDFPEIILNDVDGKQQKLSSYKGNLIALIFWDINKVDQRLFNQDLIRLYEKYHKKGFEVFQVALTSDRTGWAMQVKEQQLPWVSVSDPAVTASVGALLYNVDHLPAMYLISKEGDIIARDLFETSRLEGEIRRNL